MSGKELSDVVDKSAVADESSVADESAVADGTFKMIVRDINKTSKQYIKHEPDWSEIVRHQAIMLNQFVTSPSALYQVACTSRIIFKGVNENKLSRLYGALACYIDTKTLPKDYSEIRNLGVTNAAA